MQRENREQVGSKASIVENSNNSSNSMEEGNYNPNVVIGPGDSELDGLEIEERKRKRVGPVTSEERTQEVTMHHQDHVLSKDDCSGTSNTLLAQLAKQASH